MHKANFNWNELATRPQRPPPQLSSLYLAGLAKSRLHSILDNLGAKLILHTCVDTDGDRRGGGVSMHILFTVNATVDEVKFRTSLTSRRGLHNL
jgi:hypothetical protein